MELFGYNRGIIHSCFNRASITYKGKGNSTAYNIDMGGIVGFSEDDSMVKACYNVGNLCIGNGRTTRYYCALGGLVGRFSGTQFLLIKCGYNFGSLSESNNVEGCTVGRNNRLVGK